MKNQQFDQAGHLMDLDERAVELFKEAEALSDTDLRGALAKMREALLIEPDYPNLEDEIFIREDAITKLDGVLEFIVVLLREGKDYQACGMLQGLPANYIIQDKSGLVGGLEEKIARVERLVEQAGELVGVDSAKAYSLFEEAHQLVADYPGLTDNLASLRESVTRYNNSISSIEQALQKKDVKRATELLASFKEDFPNDENVGRFKVSIINLTKKLKQKKGRKISFILILAVIASVLAIIGAYFSFEMAMIKKAGEQWTEVNRLLAAQKFTETQIACREINKSLARVRLFFLGSKQELQHKVDDVLQSEIVAKGAEGKVLFDGEYIPKEQLSVTKEIKNVIEEARALAVAGNYVEAISRFENALAAATNMDDGNTTALVDDIRQAITSCRLNILGDYAARARALLATGSYDAALTKIREAVAMIEEHAIAASEPVVIKVFETSREIGSAKLKELLAIGDKLYAMGSYDNAIKGYKAALDFADSNKLGDAALNFKIKDMINKCGVMDAISSGDRYFATGKWAEASDAYQRGLALALKFDLSELPAFSRVQLNLQQADKMQLVADLARRSALANQYLQGKKIDKAKGVYQEALGLAKVSKWRNDGDVVVLIEEMESGLGQIEEQTFVESKKKFVVDRYATILKKAFGLGSGIALLNPEVVLMESTPDLLKFSIAAMSYTKSGEKGKYSRYQAIYVFDRNAATWALVNKSSGSKVSEDPGYN